MLVVACYPCSVYGHPCVQEEGYVSPSNRPLTVHEQMVEALGEPLAGHRWFDVALWRRFPSLWPEWIGQLQAEDAFSAVVQLMHAYGITMVACAVAIALDGSLIYRAYEVRGVERGLVWFSGCRNADSAAPGGRKPVEKRSVSL